MQWLCVFPFSFVGLLFVVLATPLIEQRVKPNYVYGLRTPKTLKDSAIWYRANAFHGKTLRKAGVITLLAALFGFPLCALPSGGIALYTSVWLTAMLSSLCWSLFVTFRYLNTL